MTKQSKEIGAYEARTHLAELLRKVAAGGRFTITQRGRPVAELIPVGSSREQEAAAAAAAMRAFVHRTPPITDADIRALIEEGRD
ncbi:type II toxin-antitoxin system prevent-host-death family antitoxin [Aquisalimonas sp.]|uniref:type II toxin-antitoxin system Phd/YefM family antitoxin n=1 Tax=Aquisalimonas sp. TaxID=1872621 RepID=UPI0025B93102|nr:type II toxin-antitoxin system prevent-host-death family antitoxin [Aquisalimonas sp.]